MALIRTFVAVETPPEVRRKAASIIHRLSSSGAKVKWVAPEHLHLTLKFIGDVTHEHIADVCRAIQGVVEPFHPFVASFGGLGAFPSVTRPRTIWIGVQTEEEAFRQLHQAIDDVLDPMGYPAERRKFHPHLTLGRVRGGRRLSELSELLLEMADEPCDEVPVDEVLIFSSQLERRGPTYDILGRGPLQGGGK